jgi:hypothetical protein
LRVLHVVAAPGLKVSELRALNSKPTGFHRWMAPGVTYEMSSEVDDPETLQTAIKWLKKGDLLPADAETARLAGVAFKTPEKAPEKTKAPKGEG